MNENQLLALVEDILRLYSENKITQNAAIYSSEFLSLMGDIKDTLSHIE